MPRLADLQHRTADTGHFGIVWDATDDSFADTGVSESYADLRMADSFADTGDSFTDTGDSFADTAGSERDRELEASGKVPQLLPRRLAPKEYYAPVVSLKKIERIEINSYKVVSGVVFYVLDVFLVHSTSRIPTVALQQVQSIKSRQRQRAARSGGNRRPDYRVLRRFSDFDKMRHHVGRFARFQVLGSCPYCDALRVFLATCYAKPVPVVKLFFQKPEARIKMLERFVNRMVQLAVGRVSETFNSRLQHQTMCAGFNAVPTLVDQFVRPGWLA